MIMAELRRVYWDACVWLGLINGEPKKRRAVEYIYNSARTGTYEIWTSTMSYVEVFRIKGEEGNPKPYPDVGLDKISEVFEQDFVKLVPVDVEVAKLARRLLREHSALKKRPDAIHLASAMRWSIETLHTYDGADLLHLDRKLNTKNGTILRITVPDDPPDGPLFEGTS
jgi:predicted nucleic acid-binding protein